MSERNDHELLADFNRNASEGAFAELVARHVNLVHSVALRHSGDPHHATEITQAVFIILAQKAGKLSSRIVLSGWLYQTARLTAANFVRGEIHRQQREQEAYMQSTLNDNDPAAWRQIAPLLDEAMGHLGETDRTAVVMRFFENKTAQEVAAALKLTEAAAHKRVNRALEKLRKIFTKRGVTLSATVIAGAVSTNSVQAAPAGLAAAVAVAATKGTAAGTATLTLIKGALKVMAWTKAKTAIIAGAVVLLAAGTTTVTIGKIRQHQADDSWRTADFDSRVLSRLSPRVKILPAKSPHSGGYGIANGKRMGTCVDAETIVQMAYDFWSPERTVVATELPADKYDFIANLPAGNAEALRLEAVKQFGVVARRELIETNVLLLTVKIPGAQGLKPSQNKKGSTQISTPSHFSCVNQQVFTVVNMLENKLQVPVIDKTGLTHKFDIDLKWAENDPQNESLKQALLDRLGLELVPSQEKIEMLIIEKAK